MSGRKLFGTNGIRGDAEEFFTNQFCFDIGRTFSIFLSQKSVKNKILAVAMDPRPSSQRIKQAVIAGIDQNWKILDEGMIPTPALNYFIKTKDCAGIMISGSHIKEELNGLKFFVNHQEITKNDEIVIENIYYQEKEKLLLQSNKRAKQSLFQKKEILTQSDNQAKHLYTEMLISLAEDSFSGIKVVIDAGNGTQSETIPSALEKLGAEVIKLNCDLNQPLLARDTETEDAFPELRQRIISQKANLGVGYDADGDRAIFITETGETLDGEISCSIIAKYSPGKTIVTPINTSNVAEYLGKKVIRTKVGVLYVVEAMEKSNAQLGFESNGGLISGEIFYGRDAGSATIKMFNIIRKTGKKLSQLVSELPKYFTIKEKIDCPWEKDPLIFEAVKEKYKEYKIEGLDGLKVWLDQNSWILFRPSGNAPEFRVFAEAKNETKAKSLADEGMSLVKSIIQKEV